jgi:3-deoxy-D-manno-octulosonic-acid transferase
MRLFYSLMWWLALPLVLTRLWLRGRKEPATASTGASAWAFYPAPPTPRWRCAQVLWVHAVSVGETRAAEPLVDALLAEYPHSRIILTHMTPTGRATGKACSPSTASVCAILPAVRHGQHGRASSATSAASAS